MLFLSCKANARVYLVKTGPPSHCSLLVNCVVLYLVLILLFYVLCLSNVLFYVFSLCKCELYYCHRVSTELQLNISYHIITYHISYHIISYHIISYHIISYHIISYHIISYHIIYII